MSPLNFTIPVRTFNPLNGSHGDWRPHASRRKRERELTALCFRSATKGTKPSLPVDVTLTRVGPRKMDGDGAQASLKSIRDQLAQELGADDGDEASIRFTYAQASHSAKWESRWYVAVEIKEIE